MEILLHLNEALWAWYWQWAHTSGATTNPGVSVLVFVVGMFLSVWWLWPALGALGVIWLLFGHRDAQG
jgi:hypothetical protein